MPLGGFRLNSLGIQISTAPNYGTVCAVAFDSGEYYYDESVTSCYSDTKITTISYWVKKDSMAQYCQHGNTILLLQSTD